MPILTGLVMARGKGLLFGKLGGSGLLVDLGGSGFLIRKGRWQVLVFQRSISRGRLRLGGYPIRAARLFDVVVFPSAVLRWGSVEPQAHKAKNQDILFPAASDCSSRSLEAFLSF